MDQPWSGPWVQMALFCERALIDTEGVVTPVRVIDRIVRTTAGPNPERQMEPFEWDQWLVIALKAGTALGRGQMRLDVETPDGLRRLLLAVPCHFESPDRGNNIIQPMRILFELEGLYWFDVFYDNRLLTRIPYRIVYRPTQVPDRPPIGPAR